VLLLGWTWTTERSPFKGRPRSTFLGMFPSSYKKFSIFYN
jgi:hypothetical protein